MTEIRCPVCGRPNSEFRESCEFCGASLETPDAAIYGQRLSSFPEQEADQPAEEKLPSTPEEEPALPPPLPEDQVPQEEPEDQVGWLDMLGEDRDQPPRDDLFSAEEPPAPPPEAPQREEKPETDWLERIKRLDQSSEQVDDDSSFPDWLAVAGDEQKNTEEQTTESSPPPDDELPDWLQMDDEDELLNEFLKQKSLQDAEYGMLRDAAEETPEPEPPQEKPEEPPKFPSWASDEDRESARQVPDELRFLAGEMEDEGEQESGPAVDPFQIEEEDMLDDLFEEELPDWLTSASSQEVNLPEEDLAQAELPGWVEAMRPVVESAEALEYEDEDEYIENYGPLAGIPSILPAEAETQLDPDSPSTQKLDLAVTKTQQEYVGMLQQLIAAEGKTKTIQKPAPIATQRMLRWLIALILIITVGGSIIFGGPVEMQGPPPDQNSQLGYVSLYEIIGNLETEDPVLLAFDYLPASAGEMNTAAAPVISHLMEQGTYLSLISTKPTGPALGEYFLRSTQSEFDYRSSQQYVNLGYLPGEAAGLLSFVRAPKQIIPLAYDGSNAWGAPPLVAVERLADFETVLVITDDPNSAKIWIEQVEPYLLNTPLVMIISAQAEPLVRPYYQSNPQPVDGYAAGIIDSMNYERLNSSPGSAHSIWLPFNIGIVIGAGTIFIGGMANGILALFTQHRTRDRGDSQ